MKPNTLLHAAQARQAVRRMLARRFLLRFHVALLLFWTFAVGLLTTKGLLWLGVESMAVRYPLAVLVAYLGFLFGVRVWLWYVGIEVKDRDEADLPLDLPANGGRCQSAADAEIRPGGGGFGGGGASGEYSLAPSLQAELSPVAELGEVVSAGAESGGNAAGSLLEGAAAAEEAAIPLFLLLLIVAAVGAVFLGGAYVILEAPAVLVEAAFEALLAGGLIRAARRVDEPDWSAAVVRRTWLPFLATLLLSLAFAIGVQHYRPEVHTLMELWHG